MAIAKIQHYVPQFLLRNFLIGKNDKLHVFDKQTEKVFATNVKNIAAESRFYDFKIMDQDLTIEPGLSKIEDMAQPIISSILEADSLTRLTAEDRATLCIFLAIQFTRTKWFREQFRELPRQLEGWIRERHGEDADLSSIAQHIKVPDENELAIVAARSIARAAKDLSVHFANKIWVLGATESDYPFIIGDNPIGLQNMTDMGPYGNLGLAVRGIEIYFPLSLRRVLAMWCPSFENLFRAAALRDGAASGAQQVLAAMESGSPLAYTPKHVLNFNSIQIRHAERFIFSSNGDFALARKMLSDHESYRVGPRSTTG